MKCIFAAIHCIAIPVAMFAADSPPSYKVTYDGGSLSTIKAGSDLKLYVDSTTIRLVKDKTEVAAIPASPITEVSYGQDLHRRVGTAIGLGMLSFGGVHAFR
jgi:hypothetical protein